MFPVSDGLGDSRSTICARVTLTALFFSLCCFTVQATQEVVSKLPLTTANEFNAAVQAAKDAFPVWRRTPVPARQRIMFKLQELIREHMDELAQNVTLEQGKTLADARGDVFRGLGAFLTFSKVSRFSPSLLRKGILKLTLV